MIAIYILIAILIFACTMVIVSIIRPNKDQRSDWQRYWDDVFERNKNL